MGIDIRISELLPNLESSTFLAVPFFEVFF
jgi:hypothetical protein